MCCLHSTGSILTINGQLFDITTEAIIQGVFFFKEMQTCKHVQLFKMSFWHLFFFSFYTASQFSWKRDCPAHTSLLVSGFAFCRCVKGTDGTILCQEIPE